VVQKQKIYISTYEQRKQHKMKTNIASKQITYKKNKTKKHNKSFESVLHK